MDWVVPPDNAVMPIKGAGRVCAESLGPICNRSLGKEA